MENTEIERKWLTGELPFSPEEYECLDIEQAYLNSSPTLRVRKENESFYLTYKGSKSMPGNTDMIHSEYNLPVDEESYEHLKAKADGVVLHKKRYLIPLDGGLTAELDVFLGEHAPLRLVEVEFDSKEEALSFKAPDWFGREVTEDYHYKNVYLCKAMRGS